MSQDTRALGWFVREHTLEEIFTHLADRGAGPNACWPWRGHVTRNGYGRVRKAGVLHIAHRLSVELDGREIPDDMHVDHTCHNRDLTCNGGITCPHRRCVNPAHLEVVTPQTNILRGRGLAALNAARDTCPAGHPLAGHNLLNTAGTYRVCRECKRIRQAALNPMLSAAYHERRRQGYGWRDARRLASSDIREMRAQVR